MSGRNARPTKPIYNADGYAIALSATASGSSFAPAGVAGARRCIRADGRLPGALSQAFGKGCRWPNESGRLVRAQRSAPAAGRSAERSAQAASGARCGLSRADGRGSKAISAGGQAMGGEARRSDRRTFQTHPQRALHRAQRLRGAIRADAGGGDGGHVSSVLPQRGGDRFAADAAGTASGLCAVREI